MKWEKVNDYNVMAYKHVIDAFFSFPKREKLRIGISGVGADIHCVIVDTSIKSLRTLGDGDVDIGFDKQIYFLCAAMVAKRLKKALFHVYPDRREGKYPLSQAQTIMNMGIAKYGDKRSYPIRRLRFSDPEYCQALQVVDIVIGAIAYRLNGHYDQPNAKQAKKRLCDYILRKAKIVNPFTTTPYYLKRVALIHRPQNPIKHTPQMDPTALHPFE